MLKQISILLAGPISVLIASPKIDVVIPCHSKDYETLELCIKGVRKNCMGIDRIFVISEKMLTDNAQWVAEYTYPFSYQDVRTILKGLTTDFNQRCENHVGWYYQQMLKLYAPFVIPDLSEYFLVVDADTIFLNETTFIDDDGHALYGVGSEYWKPYFKHIDKFLPGLEKVFPNYSGICHHMLFQKTSLHDLFQEIEDLHQQSFWKAFYSYINPDYLHHSGASEYEIYFNYVFSHNYHVKIRPLKWANVAGYQGLKHYKKQGFNFVSCHEHLR